MPTFGGKLKAGDVRRDDGRPVHPWSGAHRE
jgi:hypothetical protein